MTQTLAWLSADEVERALPWRYAVDVLAQALVDGTAPGNSPARGHVPVGQGELLLMPGEAGDDIGVKLVTVHDDATVAGVPRIQGVHVCFDGRTLTPTAVLDAAALTLRRTAALGALAVARLAPDESASLLVFGTGPQAHAHVPAIDAVRPLREVVVVGRRRQPTSDLVARLRDEGFAARRGEPSDVAGVDLVACCTTATAPLFDSALLRGTATVVAMGSHSPDAREVDTALVRSATVVVESRANALATAGDIVLAVADGVPEADAVTGTLAQLCRGELEVAPDRPRLFKSVGEAWADVVTAAAALARAAGRPPADDRAQRHR